MCLNRYTYVLASSVLYISALAVGLTIHHIEGGIMLTAWLRGSLMASGFLFSSMAAVAAADTFTVNPGAIGVAGPTVQVNYADFSYVALVNQTATNGTGTFNEQGAGFFSSYRFPTRSEERRVGKEWRCRWWPCES